jgi:hypothetical protein
MLMDLQRAKFLAKRFLRRLDLRRLEKRIIRIAEEVQQNPFLEEFLRDRYEIELGLVDLLSLLSGEEAIPLAKLPKAHRAFEFTVAFIIVSRMLSPANRVAFFRRLDGYMGDDQGLNPLEHELSTALHLISDGFSVHPAEYDEQRFDWLAKKQGVEFEVECKYVDKERGHKVTRRALACFAVAFSEVKTARPRSRSALTLVSIRADDCLPADQSLANELAAQFANTAHETRSNGTSRGISWEAEELSIPDDISHDTSACAQWIEHVLVPERQLTGRNLAIRASKDGAWLVEASSLTQNKKMLSTEKQLKWSSKNQFTKTRPAIMSVRFSGLSGDDLDTLAARDKDGVTSLRIMASRLLAKRPHLHTISFPSSASILEVVTRSEAMETVVTRSTGQAYSFKNESCAFSEARAITLFSYSNDILNRP